MEKNTDAFTVGNGGKRSRGGGRRCLPGSLHQDQQAPKPVAASPGFPRGFGPFLSFCKVGFMVFAGLAVALGGHAFGADAANVEEERLRSALRDVTLQLRATQSDLATLQGTQATLAAEKKDLADKYATLKKQADADAAANHAALTKLKTQLVAGSDESTRLRQELANAKSEWGRWAEVAKAAQSERDQLKAETAAQKRRILSLEAKNVALFMVANEILSRYQDFSVGSALKAKEPFVGATRTRLENLVQDYRDRILDVRDQP